MIRVDTYLRDKSGTFTRVDDVARAPADELHIEGAICLNVNGVDIIDQSMWDDVDQLWAYITNMMVDLKKANEASTYFPDQPIKLSFERTGKTKILVSIEIGDKKRKSFIDESRLKASLRAEGIKFFEKLSRLVPANAAMYQKSIARLSNM